MNKPIDVIRRCFGDPDISKTLQRIPVSHSDIVIRTFTSVIYNINFAAILNLYVPHFIVRCGKLRDGTQWIYTKQYPYHTMGNTFS